MSGFLRLLENEIQLAALAVLVLVYGLRLVWLFRLRSRRERSYAAGSAARGAARSLLAIAMPWAMESTRRHPAFYLQFVLFHLGVAAAIALSFIIPYAPRLLERPWLVRSLQALLGAALLVGLVRFGRRLTNATLRQISGVDDFLSLLLVDLFLATAIAAAPNAALRSEWPLIALPVAVSKAAWATPLADVSTLILRAGDSRTNGLVVRLPPVYALSAETKPSMRCSTRYAIGSPISGGRFLLCSGFGSTWSGTLPSP